LIRALEGHTGPILHLALSSDGRVLASSDFDGGVRLWELPEGKLRRDLGLGRGSWQYSAYPVRLAVSPDGSVLAASRSESATVYLWTLPDGERRWLNEPHEWSHNTFSLIISPDGRLLVTGQWGHPYDEHRSFTGVRLWNLPSGELRQTVAGNWKQGNLNYLLMSSDGRLLVTEGVLDGDEEHTVQLWSLPDGQRHCAFKMPIHSLARVLTPDSRMLITGHHDSTIRLWGP